MRPSIQSLQGHPCIHQMHPSDRSHYDVEACESFLCCQEGFEIDQGPCSIFVFGGEARDNEWGKWSRVEFECMGAIHYLKMIRLRIKKKRI